ncbi:Ig-like domain-containing protein [Cellulophaga sp. L1A9]|uniref:Ig-like domain-containing protein n=1 Tax=Cellulophaga sp. L1A9 TaxID=2686362 RepID=UPI00131DB910|nr:Ig-like domain-containing protein [Cellulophaga sp. L1A9]
MKYIYAIFISLLLYGCSSVETVVDPPVAFNDSAISIENTTITLLILENDELNNQATITSYDAESENGGTIVERLSSSFVYTPPTNFVGTDSFTYTICDVLSTPNCSTATVTITVNDEGEAVAVDDEFETVENSTLEITSLLENDIIVDGAVLESINTDGITGTIILNDDNSISYTALNGFVGNEVFTYTICDNDDTPTCSTAVVTITVVDDGEPVADDDTFFISENTSGNILDVLSNDGIFDEAEISSIDDSTAQGTVTLNADGTVSYSTLTDFEGDDTFTYTLCDDDSPSATCVTATVTVTVIKSLSFNISEDLQEYYDGVLFTDNADVMYDEIETHTKSMHTTILSYSQRHLYLYNADADLVNQDNVTLMYSGESRYWEEYTSGINSYSPQTFNTEHIYPQSLLTSTDAVTDLHHLRAADDAVNSERLNYPYTDSSGGYALVNNNSWYPGDDWRGDVARMVMYLNIRYGESFSRVGELELFLSWNIADPVSEFEEQRNNVIYAAQGNRNPFIDNPYLATLIWGGASAQNKW